MQRIQRLSLILTLALLTSLTARALAEDPKPEKKAATVKLTIDYGDGVQTVFSRLKWSKDLTVLDAMKLAQQHPRGITYKHRGKGATAFLTQIDELKNEGRGRNWIFRVNGKLGEESFGVVKLNAGDAILWKFGKYR